MSTNSDRISTALNILTAGLSPYVEDKLKLIYRDNWKRVARGSFRDDRSRALAPTATDDIDWDAHSLLTVMWDQWNTVFRHDMSHAERSLVSELREFRNRWAHQQEFDFDDTYRVVDSVRRLLKAANAANIRAIVEEKSDLLEEHVAEAVNTQVQRTAFQRNKWWIILIYGMCCVLIVTHLLMSDSDATLEGSLAMISFVLLLFVYLTYQQFKMEPPLLYGPHECPTCHKIIYRRNCPYCQGR